MKYFLFALALHLAVLGIMVFHYVFEKKTELHASAVSPSIIASIVPEKLSEPLKKDFTENIKADIKKIDEPKEPEELLKIENNKRSKSTEEYRTKQLEKQLEKQVEKQVEKQKQLEKNKLEQLAQVEQAKLEKIKLEKIKLEKAKKEAEKKHKEEQAKREAIERANEIQAQREAQRLLEQKRLAQVQKAMQEKAMQEAAQQMAAQQAAAEQAHLHRIIDRYALLMRAKIHQNWRRPVGIDNIYKCKVAVRLGTQGEVLSAKVIDSSGNIEFDRSAELAIHKSSPLPLPPDEKTRVPFNNFTFTFEPQTA